MPWAYDDEHKFQNDLTLHEKEAYWEHVTRCRTCGAEYAKKLNYCPGCAGKALKKASLVILFLLSTFKMFKWW